MMNMETETAKTDVGAGHYLEYIVRLAIAGGYITEKRKLMLEMELTRLFENSASSMLVGEGATMRLEIAEELMRSVMYTIGIALKTAQCKESAMLFLAGKANMWPINSKSEYKTSKENQCTLKENGLLKAKEINTNEPLFTLYQTGARLLPQMVQRAGRLLRAARNTCIVTSSVYYNDAVGKGMGAFFKSYNTISGAHKTPADIDYPLSVPLWEKDENQTEQNGVEYVEKWLTRFIMENRVLNVFGSHAVHGFMQKRMPKYHTVPVNLFEPVLLCTTACLLTGQTPFGFCLDEKEISGLAGRVLTAQKTKQILEQGTEKTARFLNLNKDDALRAYIHIVIMQNLPFCMAAAQNGRLMDFFKGK